jgi:hypothetical protein
MRAILLVCTGRYATGFPTRSRPWGWEIGAGGLTILWLLHPVDAVNEKVHTPVSVRLAMADVGCLGEYGRKLLAEKAFSLVTALPLMVGLSDLRRYVPDFRTAGLRPRFFPIQNSRVRRGPSRRPDPVSGRTMGRPEPLAATQRVVQELSRKASRRNGVRRQVSQRRHIVSRTSQTR